MFTDNPAEGEVAFNADPASARRDVDRMNRVLFQPELVSADEALQVCKKPRTGEAVFAFKIANLEGLENPKRTKSRAPEGPPPAAGSSDSGSSASNLNLAKFFLLNHFRAGLPTELRRVLNLQNEDELRLNAAVKLATIEARSREEAKCQSKIYATEVVSNNQEPHIEAVRQTWRPANQAQSNQYRPQNRNQNQQQRSNNQSWRQGAGSNTNKNGQTCIYCKRQGHRQEECRKRQKANKPCLDSNGRAFWPKVNITENQPTNNLEVPSYSFQDFQ